MHFQIINKGILRRNICGSCAIIAVDYQDDAKRGNLFVIEWLETPQLKIAFKCKNWVSSWKLWIVGEKQKCRRGTISVIEIKRTRKLTFGTKFSVIDTSSFWSCPELLSKLFDKLQRKNLKKMSKVIIDQYLWVWRLGQNSIENFQIMKPI